MRLGRAFLAGVAGGVATSAEHAIARASGVGVAPELLLGTLVAPPGPTALVLGVAMHLAWCGLVGLGYAWVFEHVLRRADAITGIAVAIPHAALAGVALALVPALHPRVPESVAAPGVFMSAHGAVAAVVFVLAHAIYGVIAGELYGRMLDPDGARSSRGRRLGNRWAW